MEWEKGQRGVERRKRWTVGCSGGENEGGSGVQYRSSGTHVERDTEEWEKREKKKKNRKMAMGRH